MLLLNIFLGEELMNYIGNYQNFIRNIESERTETHHIIPQSQGGSNEECNLTKLTPAEHCWAHILYDLQYGTDTSLAFRNFLGLRGKKLEDIRYEECLVLNTMFKVRNEQASEAMKAHWSNEEKSNLTRQRMREAKLGKVNVCVSTFWINNGESNKRVKQGTELPEGWKVGQIRRKRDE